MHHIQHTELTELIFFFQNKRRTPVWGVGLFAAILMSVSGWVEDFIKAFGHLSSAERETFPSSPVCVSGGAGASHSTKEYLSFQLVRWIKWPSCRAGKAKKETESWRGRWGDGEIYCGGNVPQRKRADKRVRGGGCLPSNTLRKIKQ